MSNNPQQPNNGRPMPPNYSQASGPQQPYSQQNNGSQQPGYGSQQYGSQQQNQPGQSGYGSQQHYGSQQQYGSASAGQQYGSNTGAPQGQQQYSQQSGGAQQHSQQSHPGQQQYAQSYGQQAYGQQSCGQQAYGQPGPGYGAQPVYNPAMFYSRMLPENAYGPGSEMFWQANESDRTTALWTQIGSLFIWFLPLIMFLVKKDESPFVREHSRQALNAAITNTIATYAALFIFGFVGFLLALVTFGFGMLLMYVALIIPIVYAVFYIIAAIAANKGEGYKIPLVFNFVK